ncbi:MAG: hypothetical protein ACKO7B_07850, partial [Flavobacteriales bacterium]
MKNRTIQNTGFRVNLFLIVSLLFSLSLKAQTTSIYDYVVYGGQSGATGVTAPPAPGFGVVLSSSTTMQSGNIGSQTLIQTNGNSTLGCNLFSGGKISLNNSNVVSGRITTANTAGATG